MFGIGQLCDSARVQIYRNFASSPLVACTLRRSGACMGNDECALGPIPSCAASYLKPLLRDPTLTCGIRMASVPCAARQQVSVTRGTLTQRPCNDRLSSHREGAHTGVC